MSIELCQLDCGKKRAAWVHLHSLATSLGDCLWFHKSNTIKYLRVVFPVHQLRTCLFSALEDSELLGPLWRRWLHQASRISQQISLISLLNTLNTWELLDSSKFTRFCPPMSPCFLGALCFPFHNYFPSASSRWRSITSIERWLGALREYCGHLVTKKVFVEAPKIWPIQCCRQNLFP